MEEVMEATDEKVMTIEEIEKQFDSEWALIADPQTDERLKVLKGMEYAL